MKNINEKKKNEKAYKLKVGFCLFYSLVRVREFVVWNSFHFLKKLTPLCRDRYCADAPLVNNNDGLAQCVKEHSPSTTYLFHFTCVAHKLCACVRTYVGYDDGKPVPLALRLSIIVYDENIQLHNVECHRSKFNSLPSDSAEREREKLPRKVRHDQVTTMNRFHDRFTCHHSLLCEDVFELSGAGIRPCLSVCVCVCLCS